MVKIRKGQITSGSATDGQVLTADGSGNADWEAPAGGASALGDLTDVDLSTPPTDGQALVYDDGTDTWIPGSGAASPDASAIHVNATGEIHGLTEETTPADADEIVIESAANSYAKRRVQISNLPGGGGLTNTYYGWRFGASLYGSTGADQSRTSGSAYQQMRGYVWFKQTIQITEVRWDLKTGTYTLYIGGVSQGTATLGGDGEAVWDLSGAPVAVAAGTMPEFKVVKSTGTVQFQDVAANNNELFVCQTPSYYDAASANYCLPIKINGYVGTFEEMS